MTSAAGNSISSTRVPGARSFTNRVLLVAAVCVATATALAFQAASALADTGTPINGSIHLTIVPVDPANPTGAVTVYAQGQWNWTTHKSDCNTDRAGAGVSLIWNDANEPGYPISGTDVNKQKITYGVGVKQKLNGDTYNVIDGTVHPVDIGIQGGANSPKPGLTPQVFFDPAPAASGAAQDFTHWRGGCGREPLTAAPNAGIPYGSWGYNNAVNGGLGFSHTYLHRSDVTSVCVNLYDVHGGDKVGGHNFQIPAASNEIDAGKAGDNTISAGQFDAAGLNCVQPGADLAITKTDGTSTVTAGTSTTYTITVTNLGRATATAQTVSDHLPGGFTSDSWAAVASAGSSASPTSGAGDINDTVTIPAGGNVTFTVVANISPIASGTLSNTATVTAPPGDTNPANNTATDTDTVSSPVADLSVTKTDGKTVLVPGTSTTYTVVATNAGPSAASAVVTDNLPGGVTSDSWTAVASSGASVTSASGTGNISDSVTLASGSSVTFTIVAQVDPSAVGTLANTASIAGSGGVTDPNPGNNSATDSDTLTPQADLSVTKTDGQTTLVPGTSTTYTVVASNAGPSFASGVVTDNLPTGVTADTWSAVASSGATVTTGSGTGNINDAVTLAPGSTVTFTVVAQVDPGAIGTLANTASIAGSGGVTDSNPSNNSATDSDTLTPVADFAITKDDGVTSVSPGGSTTYTIVAGNGGPSAASAVVSDLVPVGISSASWTASASPGATVATPSGTGDINDLVTLPPGGSVTFTLVAQIASGMSGTLLNTATIMASGGVTDPSSGNNSASDSDTVTPTGADLSITKDDGIGSAFPGDPTTYTIVVTNNGPAAAGPVTVTDTLPGNVGPVNWTAVASPGASVTTASGTGSISDSVTLAAGASVTFTVMITHVEPNFVDATGSYFVNTATVDVPANDPDPSNNTATDSDYMLGL